MKHHDIRLDRIAFIGNYLPRQCGIATFTYDLRHAVAAHLPQTDCSVVSVSDHPGSYRYPEEVFFEIREQQLSDYRQAAEFLRYREIETVCVQHEFGIFGGEDGAHLLTFLREARLPAVTTLHTILTEPTTSQRQVFEEIVGLSSKLVVMSHRGVRILKEVYGITDDKLALIPHGIPDMPFVDPAFYKDQFGVEGRKVMLTFGLLSPGKGLEYAIEAMPEIVAAHPDVVYIILGATHPNLVRQEGEAYRFKLQQMARDLGVSDHVLFFNRFVELEELKEFIGACDVYLTPYLNPAQIISGTLAYTYGCGKPVVSTPYWHAEELLADERGVLVPFRDAGAIANAVNELLSDDTRRNAMRKQAYLSGREMIWSRVAQQYGDVFREARIQSGPSRPVPLRERGSSEEPAALTGLPEIRLDHLRRLTDSTGMFQHAVFSFPNFNEGYCVDDNARALVFTSMLEELRDGQTSSNDLARTYAAFVQHAFNREIGRFRNFMSFDRKWLEPQGSEDSQARVLWALGTCVARSRNEGLAAWAAKLFEEALPGVLAAGSPRAWAFTILGLGEYRRRLAGARPMIAAVRDLGDRLMRLLKEQRSDEWPWFEPILSYANAKLPHGLIVAGHQLEDNTMIEAGLRSLEWLVGIQKDRRGYFLPIGSNGFFPKGGPRAEFDQQPIEAHATISATIAAFRVTRNRSWLDEALCAFRWFLGANKLGLPVYDAETGGCRDGLQVDRLNENQGAESTLAFLLSLAELKTQEHALSRTAPKSAVDRNAVPQLESRP